MLDDGVNDANVRLLKQCCLKVTFSTYSDMLNSNLITFFRFKKSLPIYSEKSRKRDVTANIKMTEYVDFALSDLVLIAKVVADE